MRLLDDFLDHQSILTALCLHKARPPVMRDLLPDTVPSGLIHKMYKHVNKSSPPQGQLPSEIRTYLNTPKRRLHSTVLVCAYERVKVEGITDNRAGQFVEAYQSYLATFPKPDLIYDFNRTWFFLRQFSLKRVALDKCLRCGHQYVYNREDMSDWKSCCTCQLITPVRPDVSLFNRTSTVIPRAAG